MQPANEVIRTRIRVLAILLTVIVLIAAPLTGWYFTALHYRTHGDVKENTQPKKRFSFSMRKEKDGETV